jgi:hypothetical protein
LLVLAAILLAGAGIAALINMNYSVAHKGAQLFSTTYTYAVATIGLGVAGAWLVLSRLHDPNTLEIAQRQALAQAPAMGRDEWERLLAEQTGD